MRGIVFSFFFLGITFFPETSQSQTVDKEKKVVFQPQLSFRSFWMNTSYSNEALRSDYALGLSSLIGGKLTLQKKWEIQAGYRVFGNAFSSEFWLPDPVTGQANRYETGMFNVLDPQDRFFGRLELLSLGYSHPKFGFKLGKMGIQSDWVNAQDGRLSPTVVEGIQAWYTPKHNWKITAWGINRMNIRGSKDWLAIGETVGLFPMLICPGSRESFSWPGPLRLKFAITEARLSASATMIILWRLMQKALFGIIGDRLVKLMSPIVADSRGIAFCSRMGFKS